jgi:hypothetical protein
VWPCTRTERGNLIVQTASGPEDCTWSPSGTFCDLETTTIAGQIVVDNINDPLRPIP